MAKPAKRTTEDFEDIIFTNQETLFDEKDGSINPENDSTDDEIEDDFGISESDDDTVEKFKDFNIDDSDISLESGEEFDDEYSDEGFDQLGSTDSSEEGDESDDWEDIEDEEDDESSITDSDQSKISKGKPLKSPLKGKILEKTKSITNSKLSPSQSNVKKGLTKSKQRKVKQHTTETPEKSAAAGKNEQEEKSEDQTNKELIDEYAEDSSDEEDLRNTIGNIPINWYDEYDHLGYGLDGLPIKKPAKVDTLDAFLSKMENPDFARSVLDKQTGQNVRLSDEHVELVRRLLSCRVPDASYDMYAPFLDLFSHEVMEMPLSGQPEHKRSFIPSKGERQKVVRMAMAMRRYWAMRKRRKLAGKKKKISKPKYYDLWAPRGEDDPRIKGVTDHIPAPKERVPGHNVSYNPPPEYLMTDNDVRNLEKPWGGDGEKMFKKFWRKYSSVREIPRYNKTIADRYARLEDLYLAPRLKFERVVAKSEQFLPRLPDKKDLRPYPTLEGLQFKGHLSIIRTISVHSSGKYLASGSDDNTVKIWEVNTGRCLRTFDIGSVAKKVCWNPNPKLFLLGISFKDSVVFLNPETYLTDKIVVQQTNAIFEEAVQQGDYIASDRIEGTVSWRQPTSDEWKRGFRVVLEHYKEIKEVVWHKQGDYFASVIPDVSHRSVVVHQLSRWRSQLPFKKGKGLVQTVKFHPKLPQLFVGTQTHIRVYDLKRQTLIKKVKAASRWISSMAVHPGGEHFIIGGYDRKVIWFEVECTKRPHVMRYHDKAVRSVSFHRKYPLYASCSDDKVIVTHATVYDDWLKDPLIVPVKQLVGHSRFDDLLVLDVAWHPFEPYLFTAGADGTIRLWH